MVSVKQVDDMQSATSLNQSNYDGYGPLKESRLFREQVGKRENKISLQIINVYLTLGDFENVFNMLTWRHSLDTNRGVLGMLVFSFERNSLKQNIILSVRTSPLWKHGDKNDSPLGKVRDTLTWKRYDVDLKGWLEWSSSPQKWSLTWPYLQPEQPK